MIDPSRSNVELKSTMSQYFKNRTKTKRVLSPIKARELTPNKTQKNFYESSNGGNQNISILKNDISAINDYIKVYKDILIYYKNDILSGNSLKNRIIKIDKNASKQLDHICNNYAKEAKDFKKLYDEHNCSSKDELITSLAFENNLMKLYIYNLNNLFFLIDLKYFDENNNFSNQYKESISKFDNIKFCLDKLPTLDNNKTFRFSSIKPNSINSFELGDINELNREIQEMNKFEEFLEWELPDHPFAESLDKIKELFYKFNEDILGLFVSFIQDKLQVNTPLLRKTKMAMSNNINDIEEYSLLIRKVMEDKFDELQKQIQLLSKDNGDLRTSLSDAQGNIKRYKNKVDDFNNRDYKTYFERMKEENNKFFEDIKKIERERCADLYDKLRDRQEKLDNIKKEIKRYKNEIEALKKQNEFNNRIPYQKKDEYYDALIKNFDDMINGFNEKFDDLSEQYYNNKMVLKKKISLLEDENKTAKALQNLLEKRLKDIDRMFSK